MRVLYLEKRGIPNVGIDLYQVELHSNDLPHQPHTSARGAWHQVIQVDRHLEKGLLAIQSVYLCMDV